MGRYKLLGEIWDKCNTKDYQIKDINTNNVLLYSKGYCLLDYEKPYERKILLSTLLDASNDKRNKIIKSLKNCDKLYIVLDCFSKENNPIVRTFYEKRMKQINYELSVSLNKNCKIYFVN